MDSTVTNARQTFVNDLSKLADRPPAPPLQRDDIPRLAKHLLKTICTPNTHNLQTCKYHLVTSILPSSARTRTLTTFLVALAQQSPPSRITSDADGSSNRNEAWPAICDPSIRRLATLLVIHDLLISVTGSAAITGIISMPKPSPVDEASVEELKSCANLLFRVTAVHGLSSNHDEELAKDLCALIEVWRELNVFTAGELRAFASVTDSVATREWPNVLGESRDLQEKAVATGSSTLALPTQKRPLPGRHGVKGDPLAPWHELPAANGLMMKRQRGYPLRAAAMPPGGYPIRCGGKPADSNLTQEVDWLISEVKHCYDKISDASEVQDIDPLGNKVWKDADRPTRNYYGWSLDGIAKRKELAKKFRASAVGYHDVPFVPMFVPSSQGQFYDYDQTRSYGGSESRGGRGGGWRGGRGGGAPWRGGRGSYRGSSNAPRYF